MVLLGDLRRDQGALMGPLSAHHAYSTARGLFSHLDSPRRLAQVELLIVLLEEMSWNISSALRRYELFAADERLSGRDRARARLWLGRALSKQGDYDRAIPAMTYAAHEFEDLGEPDNWSVAQQKIALALRGRGDLDGALRRIEVAHSGSRDGSPLQRVRLNTAHAHILLSDPATRDEGRSVLDGTARMADDYGLGHQLRSIENIRRSGGSFPATPPQGVTDEDATGSAGVGTRAAGDR
jgi:tetratricopeptide (TPR) repeat protein